MRLHVRVRLSKFILSHSRGDFSHVRAMEGRVAKMTGNVEKKLA